MNTTVTVVINADMILLDDLLASIAHVRDKFDDWLIIGSRYDATFKIDENLFKQDDWQVIIRERALRETVMHNYGGVDYYVSVVSQGNPYKCFTGSIIPPFNYGRSKSDNWIVQTAINNKKHVFDASRTVVAIHQYHSYEHMRTNAEKINQTMKEKSSPAYAKHVRRDVSAQSGVQLKNSSSGLVNKPFWYVKKNVDVLFNEFLAYTYGNYKNQQGTPLHAPWILSNCVDKDFEYICLQKRVRPGVCNCEHSSHVRKTLMDPKIASDKTTIQCGSISKLKPKSYYQQV